MNNILKRLIYTGVLLLSVNVNAGLIYFAESARTSEQVMVNLTGSGFDNGLTSGSFFASWDTDLLDYAGIDFNTALFDLDNEIGHLDTVSGYLDEGVFSALTGVGAGVTSGEFVIATITFDIVANGLSTINVAQGWDLFGPLSYTDAAGNQLTDVSFQGSFVKVAEPWMLGLFVVGLAGLLIRQHKFDHNTLE